VRAQWSLFYSRLWAEIPSCRFDGTTARSDFVFTISSTKRESGRSVILTVFANRTVPEAIFEPTTPDKTYNVIVKINVWAVFGYLQKDCILVAPPSIQYLLCCFTLCMTCHVCGSFYGKTSSSGTMNEKCFPLVWLCYKH
jgi:hypothetical protein